MSNAREAVLTHVAKPTDSIPSMLADLVRFYLWVEMGCCRIRDERQQMIAMHFREAQLRVLARMMRQAAKSKPIRLVIGKSRKTGISTLIQCLFVYLSSMKNEQRAVTVAHQAEATEDIFEIAVRAAISWTKRAPDFGGRHIIRWDDVKSRYRCGTAGGIAVGAGGTPSQLHLSEVAKWEPISRKAETEYNATTSVPDNESTIIVYESTFKGRDLFWKRFDAARRELTNYGAIFVAWWMDPSLAAEPVEPFVRTEKEKTAARLAAADGIELSNPMLQWRRNKIAEIGEAVFRQEYPSTPEEAIQATKGLILPMMRTALVADLPFDPNQVADKVGASDFGFADPTVIWSGYRYDSTIWIDQVWWGVETLASEQVQGLRPGTTYYCDPASLGFRKELQAAANVAGIPCKLLAAPRKKGPGEDIATVEIRNLIQAIENDKLKITADVAEQLLIECDSFCWDERTGKPDMSHQEGACHYDSIMALKYLVMGAFRPKVTVPEPRRRSRRSKRSFAV